MIHTYQYCLEKIGEVGKIEEVKDYLVKASGLPGAVLNEGVSFQTGEHGKIISLEKNLVEILVLSRTLVKRGTKVCRTGSPLTISCGNGVLGRVFNGLGYSISARRVKSQVPENRIIDIKPLDLSARERVSRFVETGVAVVDLLVPIGGGQRELVIGDRKTGKTHFLLQTVLNQAKKGTVCIWCSIGKRKIELRLIEKFLRTHKVFKKSLVVAADSYASPGEIFLAPYTAMTHAEYFRDHGKDVLLILDDLSTHAKYYREIALLSGRFPGRESYPGDIFHVHSKLLERAGCFKINGKEAAITCLPVCESLAGDFTGYIQTNLMSITDGHLYFDGDLFLRGIRPAINIFLSVTRVGRQTQTPLLRDIDEKILTYLKKYEEAKRFLRFGPELTDEVKKILSLGDDLIKFFNQVGDEAVPVALQTVIIAGLWSSLWEGKETKDLVRRYQENSVFRSLVNTITEENTTFERLNQAVIRQKNSLLKYIK